MTTMLTQSLSTHKDLLHTRTEQIDRLNAQIQEISTLQKQDQEQVQELKERVRLRSERQAKIANLKRTIAEKRSRQRRSSTAPAAEIDPPWLDDNVRDILASSNSPMNVTPNPLQRQLLSAQLPPPQLMQAHLNAYSSHTASLQKQADELKAHSVELEGLYRKVVSLCTGVEESKVEESLPALVAAVQSERGALGQQEVGRVREFLRRVDGVPGSGEAMVEG
jgi:chromosome segregation ATPase